MSIKGQSFSGGRDGALIDFGVGTAGLANLYASGFTVCALVRFTSNSWGILGAYSDTGGSSAVRQHFISANPGGKMFGDGDFTAGFPDSGSLSDGVWRWLVFSKATGAAHYRMHYADLATLTWVHGEAVSASNHSDNATAAVMFSTQAIYALGFDSGDMAALVAFPSNLSDATIEATCTQAAADLTASNPIAGWLMPQADAGSPLVDFTGGGANESFRQLVATSADPPDFNFSLGNSFPGGMFLPFF